MPFPSTFATSNRMTCAGCCRFFGTVCACGTPRPETVLPDRVGGMMAGLIDADDGIMAASYIALGHCVPILGGSSLQPRRRQRLHTTLKVRKTATKACDRELAFVWCRLLLFFFWGGGMPAAGSGPCQWFIHVAATARESQRRQPQHRCQRDHDSSQGGGSALGFIA